MAERHYTRLEQSSSAFDKMIQRFGVVTVMNAEVYDTSKFDVNAWADMQADEILAQIQANPDALLCKLDTLKIANMTQEGPTKTVTGGQYSNPLIKFGKSARCEMQDALGNARALDALCGTVSEAAAADGAVDYTQVYALHVTEDFNGPRTIIGDSFFIHQNTGKQVKVKIIIYQFLPDSIFNLTQDAEGDATVFDMNGDLLTTTIEVSTLVASTKEKHGVFYSIIDPDSSAAKFLWKIVDNKIVLGTNCTATLDGVAVVSNTTTTPNVGQAALLIVKKDNVEVARATIIGQTPTE